MNSVSLSSLSIVFALRLYERFCYWRHCVSLRWKKERSLQLMQLGAHISTGRPRYWKSFGRYQFQKLWSPINAFEFYFTWTPLAANAVCIHGTMLRWSFCPNEGDQVGLFSRTGEVLGIIKMNGSWSVGDKKHHLSIDGIQNKEFLMYWGNFSHYCFSAPSVVRVAASWVRGARRAPGVKPLFGQK